MRGGCYEQRPLDRWRVRHRPTFVVDGPRGMIWQVSGINRIGILHLGESPGTVEARMRCVRASPPPCVESRARSSTEHSSKRTIFGRIERPSMRQIRMDHVGQHARDRVQLNATHSGR